MFRGIPAAPGIAVGPAHRLEDPLQLVVERRIPPEQVETEVSRFLRALELARAELHDLREATRRDLDEETARIFDVQIMVLEDPMAVDRTVEAIREEKKNAEFLFRRHIQEINTRLEGLSDSFFSDRAVDLRDFRAVLRTLLERIDWRRDLLVTSQVSQDTLDYTGPKVNEGSKAIFLALGEPRRELPGAFEGELPPGIRRAEVFAPGCLVLEGEPFAGHEDLAARTAGHAAIEPWPLVALVDDAEEATRSTELFLWTVFTRFEPAADLHGRATTVERFRVSVEGPLVIDARMKPWYPEVIEVDGATRDLVDRRWGEYGLP